MSKTYELFFKVASDSPETMTPSKLERFFEDIESAGKNLKSAKKYIESLPNLNSYTKQNINRIYELFV